MNSRSHDEPRLVAAAERQMQTWARTEEFEDSALRRRFDPGTAPATEFITISRETGAGGGDIARHLGAQLGWTVYDKNLLDQVSERFRVCRSMLELVDETPSNWVYDVLGTWMDRQIIPHEKFVWQLSRVMRLAARRGKAVFVGRGAQFLLPRDRLIAARIVASEGYRVEQIMRRQGIGQREAQFLVREADNGRREFVKRFFHHDIDDLHLYDLVINVEMIGAQRAAEQLMAAVRK